MHTKTQWLAPTLILALVFGSAGLQAQNGGLRYTVTITEFENQSGWEGQFRLGHAWATLLTDLLHQSQQFTVLAESSMRSAALDEQDLGASGRAAQGPNTPKTGHMTSAQLLVKGAITDVQIDNKSKSSKIGWKNIRLGGKKQTAEISATIYLVDTTTGQIMASTRLTGKATSKSGVVSYRNGDVSASADGKKDDNLTKAIGGAAEQAVVWLADQLPNIPWNGSVVAVRDGKILINRGTREGVRLGQLFLVGQRDVIRDPDTGEVLDENLIQVAQLEAIQVKEKISVCKVISGDTHKIHKGLGVQLPRG